MSAESMSMMILKGKEEHFVPGAQKTGEQNEREERGRAIRKKNHDGSLVLRNVFPGWKVKEREADVEW